MVLLLISELIKLISPLNKIFVCFTKTCWSHIADLSKYMFGSVWIYPLDEIDAYSGDAFCFAVIFVSV